MGNHPSLFKLFHSNTFKKNSVILITGASSGLGKQMAIQYSKRRVSLVLTGRNEQRLVAVKQICQNNGSKVQYYVCDITKPQQAKNLIHFAVEKFETIDVLVLNAGIIAHTSVQKLQNLDLVEKMMETNYYANVYLTKYALPCLRGHGQIVGIASLTGRLGSPQRGIYCASKFAFVGFLESLRTEQPSIRISIAYPPSIKTPMRENDLIAVQKGHEVKDHGGKDRRLDPQDAAKLIIQAADRNVDDLFFPTKNYLAVYLYPFFPQTIRKQIAKHASLDC